MTTSKTTPLHSLRPDASGVRLHFQGDRGQKAYRGHVTKDLASGEWVGWASYGRAASPDQSRTEICRSANVHVAIAAVNERVQAKANKGYGLVGGGGDYWAGQITGADLAQLTSMAS